jgi:hypothetical protein
MAAREKIMRKYLLNLLLFVLCLGMGGAYASAQTKTFSDPNVEYSFDIPSEFWKIVSKPTSLNPNVEMVYNDRQEGFFEVRKTVSNEEEMLSDVITREQDTRLQFQTGYVAGKDETFAGNLKGRVFNYEFVKSGQNMSGRLYFLKSGPKTIFVLRFVGRRDKLRGIRNETDQIARTFAVK